MIYALVQRNTSHDERLAIAQAILDGDSEVIQRHVENGTIIHIMDVQGRRIFCIHCCNPVRVTRRRAPHGRRAQHPWHFEHIEDDHTTCRCVDRVRRPPTPFALGLQNPSAHGCYILLGCEDVNDRDRTCCKTINNRRNTYCHLAGRPENQCVSTCP